MKKALSMIGKAIKWIIIILASLVVLLLAIRFIGKTIYSRVPENGINETMYIDVNGQQQWVSIYGEDKDNPVMLYLHGGPGFSTSYADWAITRKLAKDYTVISWDQRDCAKTWIHDPKNEKITAEIMRSDLEAAVDTLLDHLDKETVTLLGMSWGTYYGCDYALSHPEKVECIINLSQCVDNEQGMLGVKDELLKRTEGNTHDHELAEKYDPLLFYDLTEAEQADFDALLSASPEERPGILEKNPQLKEFMEKSKEQSSIVTTLYEKYMPEDESVFDSDINLIAAVYFNPYYSLSDYWAILHYAQDSNYTVEDQKDFYSSYSLKGKTEYKMPFYVMQGSDDDPGEVVKNYMDSVTAPDKEFRVVDGGHMSTMLQSERLAQFVHEIAEKNK